jgi:beta-lactamase class A
MNAPKTELSGITRRSLRITSAAVLALAFVVMQVRAVEDPLKAQFSQKLKSIVENSDAVVGIAIKNLATGEEFLVNENDVFPQASSIKIHILAELFHQAEEGKLRMTDVVPLPASVRVGGSGILSELSESGVSMSLYDYAVLMVVLSDNTATNLLIGQVGMEQVNKFLQMNGAEKTRLQRKMMDVKAAAEGRENVGTPKEVLAVLEKLHRGELVSKKASEEMVKILKKPKEGPIRAGVPLDVEVANKAGDLDGVRCDVGIVFLPKAPYAICVMTKLLLHDADGQRIITDVSRHAFAYFERKAYSNEFGRRIPR